MGDSERRVRKRVGEMEGKGSREEGRIKVEREGEGTREEEEEEDEEGKIGEGRSWGKS